MVKTKEKLGNQHPTQSVNLHWTKSLAPEALGYYAKTGLKYYDWQKYLLEDMMAVNDDDLWVHQNMVTPSLVVTVKQRLFIFGNCGGYIMD